MSKLPPCPACDAKLYIEHGFHCCETHGVMPYDWIIGAISQDKALDMMEKWGIVLKRKPNKSVQPSFDVTPAEVKGVAGLLNQLKLATSPVDKRKLRAALRKAGHVGGLKS